MDILHQLVHSARHACDNTHADCILCQDTVSNGLGKLAVHAVKARLNVLSHNHLGHCLRGECIKGISDVRNDVENTLPGVK